MIAPLLVIAAWSTQTNLIAQIAPGADPVSIAKQDGVTYQDRTANAPFALFSTTSDSSAAQKRLLADKNIVWVEDDEQLDTMEDVSKGGSLSAVGDGGSVVAQDKSVLSQINWNSSLAASTGRNVRLALIDTGMSRKQTGLWSQVDAFFDAFGGSADEIPMNLDTNGDKLVDGALGHGTMVAGIVNLVAPKVRLIVCKVADSDGTASAWNVIKGVAFAAVNGAEVANISLASSSQVPAFQDVAEWANSKGLVFIAAIGNANSSKAYYPAGSSKCLCVAGLNPDNTKASFSNWNSNTSSSAPCVGIVSDFWNGQLATWSGTSFAAPFVSAALADCLRRSTTQRPQDLIKAVKDSGTKIDDSNKNYKGNLGTLLDFVSLNAKLARKP